MSKKEETLRGGLNALLGGVDSQPKDEATPDQTEGEAQEEATPQEEDDLIASIEDEELKEALRRKRNEKRGRPRKNAAPRYGEGDAYTRSCWVVKRDLLAKIKQIALRETLTLKEIMDYIMSEAVKRYEKKHGEIILKDHGDVTKIFK